MMKEWRDGIINKDQESVMAIDLAFHNYPAEFRDELLRSAEHDEEPRVRAFSTRVIGNLKMQGAAELLRRLLGDKSEFVRHNAAWALGEIGDRQAASEIRRLAAKDPAPAVQTAAREALKRIESRP